MERRKAIAQVYASDDFMDDDPVRAREFAHEGLRTQLVGMGCDPATFVITVDGERDEFVHEVQPIPWWKRVLFRMTPEEPEVEVRYVFTATAREAI